MNQFWDLAFMHCPSALTNPVSCQKEGWLNITGPWGVNKSEDHKGENAFLLEGSWNKNRLALFTRYEWVQKSGDELDLDETSSGDHNKVLFPVNALTPGFNYGLLKFKNIWLTGGSILLFLPLIKAWIIYTEKIL